MPCCARACEAWREQLGLAGLMCLSLPLLSVHRQSAALGAAGSMGVGLTAMALGAMLLWACWKVSQPAVERVPRKKTAVMAEVN